MYRILFLVSALWAMNLAVSAQTTALKSGPMLGYADLREATVWVQTQQPAEVSLRFWALDTPQVKFNSTSIKTQAEKALTHCFTLSDLEPGTTYQYEVYLNKKKLSFPYPTRFKTQALWQWRTDAPDFKIAIGSCAYTNEAAYDRPSKPYGGEYMIYNAIADQTPDAMLWLGDNIYLREVDWGTRSGILHRYTHFRSLPELQKLWAMCPHYAIWDDHDYGPNDADRSYVHKDWALEAFKLFWANPSYGTPVNGGISTMAQFNDVDFFLLDDRWFRSPNDRKTGDRTIMGKEQIEWFIDALKFSRAPFKLVAIGGQFLNSEALYENYATRAEERQYIIDRINDERIKGVVFLTGDRHHTELSRLVTKDSVVIYDLTCSPLTSSSGNNRDNEKNKNRIEGSLFVQRNFGTLSFSGKRKERTMQINIYDSNGKSLWQHNISETEWK